MILIIVNLFKYQIVSQMTKKLIGIDEKGYENKLQTWYPSMHKTNLFMLQKNLSAFKSDDSVKVLLLPVHSGANGLNLIEATHVILVEPILNPAQELQVSHCNISNNKTV